MKINSPDICLADEGAELEMTVAIKLSGQIQLFRVVSCDGGIRLQGRARTYYAKQMAQHLVMKGTKQRIVANEILVE